MVGPINDEEKQAFRAELWDKRQFEELSQDDFTHENGTARSRTDRAYCNQHLSEQLERHIECSVMPFPLTLSAHQPLCFAKRVAKMQEDRGKNKPVQSWCLQHPSFPEEVKDAFEFLMKDYEDPSAFDKLSCLKEAMHLAFHFLVRNSAGQEVCMVEEKLAICLSTLKTLERNSNAEVKKHLRRYPHLRTLISNRSDRLPLREHAVELARTNVWERVEELRTLRNTLSDAGIQHRKESILQRLKRLQPGCSMSLTVMVSEDGSKITSEPTEIASLLRGHWGRVFGKKQIHLDTLGDWILQVGLSFQAAGIEEDVARWQLTQNHIEEAIDKAQDSSLGPDGILYMAWKT